MAKFEADAICAVLNNYNGLYSHAARLEARIAELEAAGVEDAEPVEEWKFKTRRFLVGELRQAGIATGNCSDYVKVLDEFNALLSRVVAVAPEVAK